MHEISEDKNTNNEDNLFFTDRFAKQQRKLHKSQ